MSLLNLKTPRPRPGPPPLRRRAWLAALGGVLALLGTPCPLSAAESALALEYKVKAGFLFNFARYVEWPAAALPETNSPIVIGVIDGADALPVIQKQLEGKAVNNRPLQVKAIAAAGPGTGCHILFVSRSAGQSASDVRQALGQSTILLVGETEQFAERGGIIGFVREEESFRIHLNLEAAAQARLKVSARISSIAKLVKTKRDK
jgi:hypothetical protein